MKKEIIFVSRIESNELFKCPKAHMDNNPLIISRFNPSSGKKIGTRVGNDLSKLVSVNNADYFYIEDLSVHNEECLSPADITAFFLAYSHKSLNNIISSSIHFTDLSLVLFEFLISKNDFSDINKRKIKSFN